MLAAEEVGTELRTGEYLSQWLRHCRGRLRSKTFEDYQGVIRLYATPGIGEIPLSRLHPLHLQQLYSVLIERGLAGGTVLNLHLVLAQALHQQLDSVLFMTLLQQLKSGLSALIEFTRCRRSTVAEALCCTARATDPQTQSEKHK